MQVGNLRVTGSLSAECEDSQPTRVLKNPQSATLRYDSNHAESHATPDKLGKSVLPPAPRDSFSFNDPEWTNHPARFYRVRSP